MNNERVCKFLKEVGTYYIATIDENKPKVRPFGTINIFENKLYFQTGLKKDVAKQILANPYIEICGFKDGKWLRLSGKAILDERIEPQEDMLNNYPNLKNMYTPGDGNTAIFYLKEATATFYSFTDKPETIEL